MNKIESALESIQKALATATETIHAESQRLERNATAITDGKFLPLEGQCVIPGFVTNGRVESFRTSGTGSVADWRVAIERARAALKEARDVAEAVHLKNIPIIENNKKVRSRLTELLAMMGIPSEHVTYGYKTRSAKSLTRTVTPAGYLADLEKVCKVNDNYELCMRAFADYEKRIERYEAESLAAAHSEARKLAEEKKKTDGLILLGQLATKYDCTPDATDILASMCQVDKYFALAYYLECNRNDWNDGPSFAETGLRYFNPETDAEHDIYNEIRALVDNWEGDGRVFRDTVSCYGHLYTMVKDQTLIEDMQKLRAHGLID